VLHVSSLSAVRRPAPRHHALRPENVVAPGLRAEAALARLATTANNVAIVAATENVAGETAEMDATDDQAKMDAMAEMGATAEMADTADMDVTVQAGHLELLAQAGRLAQAGQAEYLVPVLDQVVLQAPAAQTELLAQVGHLEPRVRLEPRDQVVHLELQAHQAPAARTEPRARVAHRDQVVHLVRVVLLEHRVLQAPAARVVLARWTITFLSI